MDRLKPVGRRAPLALRAAFLGMAGLTLGGCAMYGDGYGYTGVSVGVGYGDGYYDPYYDDPYYDGYHYGWYDDYYYPGAGYYVYDRRGYRHRWNDHHRRYWQERRSGVRAMVRENWGGYSRGEDGYYRDQRRNRARDGMTERRAGEYRDRRGEAGHESRQDKRDRGFASDAIREAARKARQSQRSGQRATSETPRRQPQAQRPVAPAVQKRSDAPAIASPRPARPAPKRARPAPRNAPVKDSKGRSTSVE